MTRKPEITSAGEHSVKNFRSRSKHKYYYLFINKKSSIYCIDLHQFIELGVEIGGKVRCAKRLNEIRFC